MQIPEVEALYKTLLLVTESIEDGLCILDKDGYITQINRAYADIFGKNPEEMMGKNIKHTFLEPMMNSVLVTEEPVIKDIPHTLNDMVTPVELIPLIIDRKVVGGVSILKRSDIVEGMNTGLKIATEKLKYMEQKIKKDRENLWHTGRYIGERLEQKLVRELKAGNSFKPFIGVNTKVLEALALAGKSAKVQSTVLICGKSGTGKELIAEGIHNASDRSHGPLIRVNCAAIPLNLLESELFGHEKGAFSGAIKKKLGKFELADKGTILLDEIGEMDINMQTKLLRVLENRTFERVGGEVTLKADVRVIAATNRNLEQMVKDGQFREDLYYRISVIPIYLPSLNERKEDIPLLVDHFLKALNLQLGKDIKGISQAAMDALTRHDWPGNVRELKNMIERVVVLIDGTYIDVCDLPACLHDTKPGAHELNSIYGSIVKDKIFPMEEYEKQIIRAALEKYGNYTAVGRVLGITHKTVAAKAQKYGLMDDVNRKNLL